jgi:transcriptional regulator with XRE-family HTH domain
MDFGTKLTQARKDKKLSQDELGKILGIDKRIISRYETGKTVPSIEVACKMASALKVSLDYLTGLNYSLFIDDIEMTNLLSDYDDFSIDQKNTIKKLIKAFKFYSKVEVAQKQLAV